MVKIVGKVCVFFLSVFAATLDANVRMEVRTEGGVHNQVVIGQPFTLDVIIDNVYGSVQVPTIKGLEGAKCGFSGSYSSSINGKSTARYSYSVRIDKLGVHTIGPAIVHHQQQELVSPTLQVTVVKDLGMSAQKNNGTANTPAKAFLRLMVDTETPFVGQKMDCTLRFYYQDPSFSLQAVNIPELAGFDIKEVSKLETGTAEIEGAHYRYAQWRWNMYPTKPGEFIIPAYSADYDIPLKENNNHILSGFFMFMGNRVDRKRVYSNAVTVKVAPLPYYTGQVHAVGSFERISADIKPGIAKEGEGMVLMIEIEGAGNLQAIATPKLSMPDALKYYDSNSAILPPRYTDELPKKRFEFIVQALKAGDYEIPEQLFTYFDVERNSYVTLCTSPLAVSIMPGVMTVKKDAIRNAPDAVSPGHEDDELADINTAGNWYTTATRKPLPWWLFELLFLLPCLYIVYPWVWQQCVALTGNSARLARRRAFRQARKKVALCIKNNNNTELYSIFMELLQQWNQPSDIHSAALLLQKYGLSGELMSEWNVFWERITHAAYAQSDRKNNNDLNWGPRVKSSETGGKNNDLGEMAKQWLDRLEKNT